MDIKERIKTALERAKKAAAENCENKESRPFYELGFLKAEFMILQHDMNM